MFKYLFSFLVLCSAISFAQTDSAALFYQNYQFGKTIDFIKKSEEKDYVLLAKAYHKVGQIDDAKESYLKAFDEDTTNISVLNNLAEFFRQTKDHAEAISMYNRLIILQPDNSYYYKKLGSLFFKIDRYAYAVVALEKAVELNEKDLESTIMLIDGLIKIKLIAKADEMVTNKLEEHPTNKSLIMQAIQIAYKLRDYEDVIAKSKLYYSTGDSSLTIQKIDGIARYQKKKYEEAVELLSNVIDVDSESEILHYYLGLCYQEIGEKEKSATYLEKAIDLGITNNIENYYVRLAVVYEELENYEKSIQYYKAAYAKSKDKILLYHLARNYDVFYKDKTTALKYYELYLAENDTANEPYFDFSKSRVNELKVSKHFDIDTLN